MGKVGWIEKELHLIKLSTRLPNVSASFLLQKSGNFSKDLVHKIYSVPIYPQRTHYIFFLFKVLLPLNAHENSLVIRCESPFTNDKDNSYLLRAKIDYLSIDSESSLSFFLMDIVPRKRLFLTWRKDLFFIVSCILTPLFLIAPLYIFFLQRWLFFGRNQKKQGLYLAEMMWQLLLHFQREPKIVTN